MNRVGVITQARTTSTRLPRKVLLPIAGKTILEHHLDRLAASGLPVYVATTTNLSDDEIHAIAASRGLGVHRGSERDVLARYHDCATAFELDVIVRVTSDCPLIDGKLIAAAVEDFIGTRDPWLYLSNTLERTFPRGFDFEVFSSTALAYAEEHATDPVHREHVTPYLYANDGGRYRLRNIPWSDDSSRYRVTLDTEEDLALIAQLIEHHDAMSLSCSEIISTLAQHPEIVALNAGVTQKGLGK